MKKQYIIPIFSPRQGCKFKCIFCSQEHIVKNEKLDLNIAGKIKEHLKTIPVNSNVEVAFYGGTFTGLDLFCQENLFKQIKPFIDQGLIDGIRISTRPDEISPENIDLLKIYKIKVVELGVQSLVDIVLKKSERGHTLKNVINSTNLLKKNKIKVGFQMMVGLPGETITHLQKSIDLLIKIKPDFVRIHPTLILKGSKLETLYNEGKYHPLTINQAVDRCLKYLLALEKTKIKILRFGLYPSDELRELGVIIAGPFHPAFRDLVEGEKFYKQIELKLNLKHYRNCILELYGNSKDISYICGQHRVNIEKLKKRYKFKDVKVIIDPKIKKGKIGVRYCQK